MMASVFADPSFGSVTNDSVAIHLESDEEDEFFDASSGNSPVKLGEDGKPFADGSSEGKPQLTEEEKKAQLEERILALVDFYFGDDNYAKDQFLRKQATLDQTGSGWISVEVVASFKKMKKLTEDRDEILRCMRRSQVVMLNEDETFLKRREPLLKDLEDTFAKTVLLGNLHSSVTIDSLKAFCGQHGTVVRVRFPFASRDSLPENVKEICFDESGVLKSGVKVENERTYAMVEYATMKQAAAAVKGLLSDRDWRTETFATLLFKRPKGTGTESPALSEASSRTQSPFIPSSSSGIVERARANSMNARMHKMQIGDVPSPIQSLNSPGHSSPSSSQDGVTSWRDRANSCNARMKDKVPTPETVAAAAVDAPTIWRSRANSLNSRPVRDLASAETASAASSGDRRPAWRTPPASSRSPSSSPQMSRRHLSPDRVPAPAAAPALRGSALAHAESPNGAWVPTNAVRRQPTGPDGTRGFMRKQPGEGCPV
jgi:hypothetical protein